MYSQMKIGLIEIRNFCFIPSFRIFSLILLLSLQIFTFCDQGHKIQAVPEFNGQSAYSFLLKQCSFGPRDPGSDGHQNCRDYLAKTLEGYADRVSRQEFTMTFGLPIKTVLATNIIAAFQPQNSSRVLLCAHWDTRPWADRDPDPRNRKKPILGANDGASGVAVLLELARILHKHEPKIGVDIVLFDGEDAGLKGSELNWIQGSTYFADTIDPEYQPEYGILLDMIGDADLAVYKEAISWEEAPSVVKHVWEKAEKLNLDVFKSDIRYAVLDDHIPLLEAGILCVNLIDFDYPYWHTIADTPDKCSASSLGKIGALLIDLIYNSSDK
jgi:hypothetical protein